MESFRWLCVTLLSPLVFPSHFHVISLTHVDTGFALSSNGQQFQRPIHGHTEVYAAKAKKSAAKWMAAEGVYLPSSAPK